jgi:glutamate synthase (NADPH/NADH)
MIYECLRGTVNDPHEIAELRGMIEDHRHFTKSEQAVRILRNFNEFLPRFVRVMPLDYKAVLEAGAKAAIQSDPHKNMPGFDIKGDAFNPAEDKAKTNVNDQVEIPSATLGHSEPPVVDLEDSMVDAESAKKIVEKLDKTKGFMKYKRLNENYRNPKSRTKDWAELSTRLSESQLKVQAARCMDCGVPFCQSDTGCPISNVIPKWNDLVFKGQWLDALNRLLMTNNFPEFTGRICPAPCEGACVLGINEAPVGIKSIEW